MTIRRGAGGRPSLVRVVAVFAAGMLIAAACGDGDDPDAGDGAAAASSAHDTTSTTDVLDNPRWANG